MGVIKYYMIVTNDGLETPVAVDLRGAKEVAEYLGVSVNRVRKNLCTGVLNHRAKYKAVVSGIVEIDHKEYQRIYQKTRRKYA